MQIFGGGSDPYCTFSADPVGILVSKGVRGKEGVRRVEQSSQQPPYLSAYLHASLFSKIVRVLLTLSYVVLCCLMPLCLSACLPLSYLMMSVSLTLRWAM